MGHAGVRQVGLEPTHPFGHRDLNPARLPIPPLAQRGHNGSGAGVRFESHDKNHCLTDLRPAGAGAPAKKATETNVLEVLGTSALLLTGRSTLAEGNYMTAIQTLVSIAPEFESIRQRALVERALDSRNLLMYFQPVVDDRSRVVGVEALARIRTTDALITAADFLGSISGTDLMVRLDMRAFELACHAAALLVRDTKNPPYVSCNISAQTLAMPNVTPVLLGLIRRHQISPSQLCIEVTESTVMEAGIAELRLLHQAGVGIALDNFGTGTSQLTDLGALPLSCVKIDRWFAAALDESGGRFNLALTVLEMAQSLQVPVIAEGIETTRQWRAAKGQGLTLMQGWLHSAAMPFAQMMSLVQQG